MITRASRRQFLKTASLMSMAGVAGPFALNLAAIGAASAQTSPGYRAIVCLFLYGGNDHTNTLIPYDQPSYDQYLAARDRSEEHTSELQSPCNLVCRLLLEKKKAKPSTTHPKTIHPL